MADVDRIESALEDAQSDVRAIRDLRKQGGRAKEIEERQRKLTQHVVFMLGLSLRSKNYENVVTALRHTLTEMEFDALLRAMMEAHPLYVTGLVDEVEVTHEDDMRLYGLFQNKGRAKEHARSLSTDPDEADVLRIFPAS